jgi:serine protease Do
MKTIARSIIFLAAGMLLSTAAFTCSFPQKSAPSGDAVEAARQTLLPAPAFASAGSVVIADIAERSVASVVNISSEKVIKMQGTQGGPFFNDPFFRHFFGRQFRVPGQPREQREKSLGSGVIISKDGLVLTNNHVVEKADRIRVTLSDGSEHEAEVVGTDPDTDIGVLRLKGELRDLQPLELGDSNDLRLGDVVLAIGNPFGVGQTVTMGIVSAKGRANVGIVDYEDFIQTDAAINPGNSGGALIDTSGKLVGINTAIISRSGGYQGIGFAIPSNMAGSIMKSLLDYGKVVRGWLGVVIQDVDTDLAEALSLPNTQGVLISDVNEGSPAEKGGLERGDVVVRVNGETVDSTGRLRNLVAVAGADAKVKIEILRGGQQKTLEVELGARPEDGSEEAEIDEDEGALGGLTLGTLNQTNRQKYRIDDSVGSGVVVTEISRGSPAARAGFRPGDVIREMNRKPVTTPSEFTSRYKNAKGSVAILIQRGRNTLFLALRKE